MVGTSVAHYRIISRMAPAGWERCIGLRTRTSDGGWRSSFCKRKGPAVRKLRPACCGRHAPPARSIPAYLFLPKNAKPPYQLMVGFSGANVFHERSSATTTDVDRFTSIMRSGRASLYPIYKSTFERGDGLKSDTPDMIANFRDHMVMWSKDVGRSVDYLESRSDVVKEKIGYIGLSAGR